MSNRAEVVPRPGLMPLDTALAGLLATVRPLVRREAVATLEADGRVLAQSLCSALDVPGHDNSSMDGYALRLTDLAQSANMALPVSQRIPAGSVPNPLLAGTVARVFTGAPIPPGADTVVMQEDVESSNDEHGQVWARFKSMPVDGQWIRRRGEDIARGSVVLESGTLLGPAELGLAASMGFAELEVAARPRVALFSTGDELVMPGDISPEQMKSGAIYNSNRFFLRSLLKRLGCEVSDLGIVPDRLDATLDAFRQAALTNDLILTSGGVSVGEEDHVKPAVEQLGGLDLWQIAMKPGKPFAHGWVGGGKNRCHFIGLPGNPVSSYVTFMLLVRPFLRRLQGVNVSMTLPQPQAMVAHFNLSKPDRRREFLRVRRNAQGGLDIFANQSSGVLTSVVWADGLVDHPAGSTIRYGDLVNYISFDNIFQ